MNELDLDNAHGKDDLDERQSWRPLVLENVQTDATREIDIGMIDSCDKLDLRRLERIVRRQVDLKLEDATLVGRVAGAVNGSFPAVDVVADVAPAEYQ